MSFHKDHLGSTTVVTDADGSTLEDFGQPELTQYRPYGQPRHGSELNTITDYNFTDQELDRSTNLYNYDARLYNPDVAMFITADTLIQKLYDPQFLNRYAYCRNNPVRYIDPSGHRIVVMGDKDFRTKVEEELQKLDPSVEVNKKTGEVTFNEDVSVEGHEKGHKLVKRVDDNKKLTARITKSKGDNKYRTNNFGKKSGGKVKFNSKSGKSAPELDEDGNINSRPPASHISLGHELIHADHDMRGISSPLSKGYYKPGTQTCLDGTERPIERQGEARTVGLPNSGNTKEDVTENDLRAESEPKISPRAWY